MDHYYSHPFVSNSDLSAIKALNEPPVPYDIDAARRRGLMLDAVITQPDQLWKYNPTRSEFDQLNLMKQKFLEDPLCARIYKSSKKQVESYHENVRFDYNGISFHLNCRCLWDFKLLSVGWGADLKRTAAKTESEFLSHCLNFDYDRSRAFYMHIDNTMQDMIIGVNEKGKIFKVIIDRDHPFFKSGMQKVNYLAYKFYVLYGKDKNKEGTRPVRY